MSPKPQPEPLLDFLREELDKADPKDDRGMRRRLRPSVPKIAGLAAATLIITTGAVILSTSSMRGPSSADGTQMAAHEPSPASEGIAARVALLEGDAVLLRSGKRVMLAETDAVHPGDSLETSEESAIGLTYPDGTAIVLDGSGRLSVRKADSSGVRVGLVYGTLAARVPPKSRDRAPLRIAGSNATLTVRGTVFSVHADRGRLVNAAVSEGEVAVTSTRDERTYRVGRMKRIDMSTWAIREGAPDSSALGHLARITDGVEIPPGEAGQETQAEPVEQPLSVADRIRNALKQGDVDAAVKLADKHRGNKSITFKMSAAEAYRHAGRWQDSADTYLAAAASGAGKKAEKAMIRAADITLRKLQKPIRAASIIDDYLARFPSGGHLDEALYIGGMANTRSGIYPKARSQFEKYLAKYPSGTQAAQVHLQLAKIFTLKTKNCSKAAKHIKAVKSKAAGTVMAETAEKLEARCEKGETP